MRRDWETMLRVWAGKQSVAKTPLDLPPKKLYEELEPKRESMAKYVKQQLQQYDSQARYPRKQDALHMCRDGYESHVCSKAMKEIYREMQVSVRANPHVASSPPVIIIALMAVHIATESRFDKLLRTLKSIEQQQYSTADVELVVAVSWYAATPELAAKVSSALLEFVTARTTVLVAAYAARVAVADLAAVRSTGIESCPESTTAAPDALTVLVAQQQRLTQFQHMRAALAAAEDEIRVHPVLQPFISAEGIKNGDEATSGAHRAGSTSFWTIFGDDDDLWHPRRVAEYARAIRGHTRLDSVGIFATTARADVRAPTDSDETQVKDGELPSTASEIDGFLSAKLGERLDKQDPCTNFARNLKLMGADAALLPIEDGIALEYFNFCPRLRILHEFFDQTSETVISHRFCDLRLCEFLTTYSRMGHELGLALEWFDTDCWMYFYANVGLDMASFQKNFEIEGDEATESVAPTLIGADNGHVSTTIPLEASDIKLGEEVCKEMLAEDETLTPARLARYVAAFRSNISMEILRRHTRTMDQRLLDWLVFTWASPSFGKFTEKLRTKSPSLKSMAANKLFKRCQGIARSVMQECDVKLVWVKQEAFLTPEPVEVDEGGNVINTKPLMAGQSAPLGIQYIQVKYAS